MWRRVLVVLGLIIVGIVAIGFLLPRHIVIARTRVIPASPAQIYPMIADFRTWEQWATWQRRDPNMTHQYEGLPGQTGSLYRWKSKEEGDGEMTHEYVSAPDSILSKLVIGGWVSHSGFSLRPAPAADGEGVTGTRVLWAMHADMGNNPLSRWMGLMLDNFIARDYDEGLQGLEQLVVTGKPAPAKSE